MSVPGLWRNILHKLYSILYTITDKNFQANTVLNLQNKVKVSTIFYHII